MTRAGSDVDALRQRLYRADAGPEDLRRYEAAAAAAPPPIPESTVPLPTTRRTLRAAPMLVTVAAVAVVIGVVAAVVPHPAARSAASSSAPSFGPGAAHRVRDGSVQEFEGRGSAAVALDRDALSFEGGELAVAVTADRTGPLVWTATRIDARHDWSSFTRVLGRTAFTLREGAPTARALRYAGAPPALIRVEAPAGVAWDLRVDTAAAVTRPAATPAGARSRSGSSPTA